MNAAKPNNSAVEMKNGHLDNLGISSARMGHTLPELQLVFKAIIITVKSVKTLER